MEWQVAGSLDRPSFTSMKLTDQQDLIRFVTKSQSRLSHHSHIKKYRINVMKEVMTIIYNLSMIILAVQQQEKTDIYRARALSYASAVLQSIIKAICLNGC